MKKIMISGYKMNELGIFNQKNDAIYYIKKAIENRLIPLCENGLEWVIVSGNLGTELWTAEICLELKKDFKDLKIAVITPFLNQEERWNDNNKMYYQNIVSRVDKFITTSEHPYITPKQFQFRDQEVLKKTDGAMLFYDSEKEGSPKYLKSKIEKHQKNNEYELILIDFYELQDVIDDENSSKDWDEGLF